jgi:hypothetical protein
MDRPRACGSAPDRRRVGRGSPGSVQSGGDRLAVFPDDYQAPSDVIVGSSSVRQGTTVVSVSYRLGDARRTAELELTRAWPGWRVVHGFSTIRVTATGARTLRINGVDVPASGDGHGDIVARALPGLYTARIPDNPLTESDSVVLAVHVGRNVATLSNLNHASSPAPSTGSTSSSAVTWMAAHNRKC